MTRILIVGNSQSSVLYATWRDRPDLLGPDITPHFYCVPGGWGPSFDVVGDRLVLPVRPNVKFEPYARPPETPGMLLASFDAIVVSALGLIGGQVGSTYDLMTQGRLHAFGPRAGEFAGLPLIGEPMYRELVGAMMRLQGGMRFLAQLGPVGGLKLVQPMPLLSRRLLDQADWLLNRLYDDAQGALRFFTRCRDAVLHEVAGAAGARLLDYPDPHWAADGFTPAEYIDNPDGFHPNRRYAAMVFAQIRDALAQTGNAS